MRKLSIYLLYGIAIFTFVTVYDFQFTRMDWLDFYYDDFGKKADRLDSEILVGRMFYQSQGDLGRLSDFLESRRRVGAINFWAVYDNGRILDASLPQADLEALRIELSLAEGVVASDSQRQRFYAVEKLNENLKLALGIRFSKEEFLRRELEVQMGTVWKYVAGLLVICLATFAFFFRDFMRSIRELRGQKGRRRFSVGRMLSREAESLARGLNAYDQQTKDLAFERDLLSLQVLPSLRSELKSGIKPPYDFSCTLVRTDINNYTKIFNEHPVTEFTVLINEFFTDVSHVVARYGGYVHEFVGDEVIYYFKDSEVGNSSATALSAIRDIHQLAASIHQQTLKERGYPFTVKSAMAHDRLRFGPLVNGHSLSGPSLIETVRILSAVTEKEGNVTVYDERHLPALENLAKSAFHAEFALKGFSHPKKLHAYRGHLPLSEVLIWESAEKLGHLTYYRSDADISETIQWISKTWKAAPLAEVLQLIGKLRKITLSKTDGRPETELHKWLEVLREEVEAGSGDATKRVFASALRLVENFSNPDNEEWHARFESLLERAIGLNDRRIMANGLDALTVIKSDRSEWIESLAKHHDNRVAANALVHEGQREIGDFVVRRLKNMLRSKDSLKISSALYAVGEIGIYHQQRDPVYFESCGDFRSLINEIPKYSVHSEVHVRRQAVLAAVKLKLAPVTDAIQTLLQEPGNEAVKEEIEKWLMAEAGEKAENATKPKSNAA